MANRIANLAGTHLVEYNGLLLPWKKSKKAPSYLAFEVYFFVKENGIVLDLLQDAQTMHWVRSEEALKKETMLNHKSLENVDILMAEEVEKFQSYWNKFLKATVEPQTLSILEDPKSEPQTFQKVYNRALKDVHEEARAQLQKLNQLAEQLYQKAENSTQKRKLAEEGALWFKTQLKFAEQLQIKEPEDFESFFWSSPQKKKDRIKKAMQICKEGLHEFSCQAPPLKSETCLEPWEALREERLEGFKQRLDFALEIMEKEFNQQVWLEKYFQVNRECWDEAYKFRSIKSEFQSELLKFFGVIEKNLTTIFESLYEGGKSVQTQKAWEDCKAELSELYKKPELWCTEKFGRSAQAPFEKLQSLIQKRWREIAETEKRENFLSHLDKALALQAKLEKFFEENLQSCIEKRKKSESRMPKLLEARQAQLSLKAEVDESLEALKVRQVELSQRFEGFFQSLKNLNGRSPSCR